MQNAEITHNKISNFTLIFSKCAFHYEIFTDSEDVFQNHRTEKTIQYMQKIQIIMLTRASKATFNVRGRYGVATE